MKHTESSIKIYSTNEYDRFRMINGNRSINMKKVENMIADIKGDNDMPPNNMLPYKPIEVKEMDDYLEILDGQHRYFVCKKLKLPVYYVIIEEDKSMQEIATINSRVDKWKMADYINCYINQGNDHYIRLQQFLNEYKINIGTSLRLLTAGNPGFDGDKNNVHSVFKSGKFKIQKWDEAVVIADLCRSFKCYQFWTDRCFVVALYRINKAGCVKMEDLRASVEKNIDKLNRQVNAKSYIYNLEQIINIGKQKRIVIA